MGDNWVATYRLQVHAGFPLTEAVAVVPYLARLGVSHVYLSPCLQATPGSMHGYDVTDPTRISDDLGGEAGWHQFCHQAHAHGLGLLLDLVPNHMAANQHNPLWDDLLAHGPASRYHRFFDVVSDPLDVRWRIHLATLGQPYGEALAKGELQVTADSGRPRLVAPGQSWPLAPATWRQLLGPDEAGDPVFDELAAALLQREFTGAVAEAYGEAVARVDLLWASRSDASRERVAEINRDPAALHVLLEAQWYALHHWRLEGEVTNYRRFFDIGTLAALRMEDPVVFAAAHQRVAAMFAARELDGVRIDHPDGLRSPRTYFERLRKLFPAGRIYVEKILENDEQLRADWPVDGTVGYDFLSKVNRLWMDEQKADALSAIYADFTGHTVNLSKVVRDKKSQIVGTLFEADLERLTRLAVTLARADWRTRDLSVTQLRAALELLVVLLPVYRTYRDGPAVDATDRTTMINLLALARARGEAIDPAIFNFLERVFLDESAYQAAEEFIARWQQLTPAVTAKG
ncbi:MAG TPA: malto-oligosyltrehalose synthase, partial [Candidatus Didemnitutus sp.]|nr:malto-oligosyltrehalose synthase [Candidatus Didemnitutus sp.]